MYKLSLGPNNEIYASGVSNATTLTFNDISYTNRPPTAALNGAYILKISQENAQPQILKC